MEIQKNDMFNSTAECYKFISAYIEWLNQNFIVEKTSNGCRIVTPFLRPDNDLIYFDVKYKKNYFEITDSGSTYNYLYLSGIDLKNSKKRKQIIESTINRTDLQFRNGEIVGFAKSYKEIGKVINNLITAIENICCLIYTGMERSKPTFKENIEIYLNEKNIQAEKNFVVEGFTQKHYIDFVVIKKEYILIE